MAEYHIQFLSSAAKEFRSLPLDIKRRIGKAVETLRQNPYHPGIHKLHGHSQLYRIRVGQYRIVYEIDEQVKLVRITRVRHRREAYNNL
ncbi:MAG: type II toxin-antitoxin system RelE family toxin [Candidatus Brocadiales bacterium]